jgi:hypothetical protein
LSNRRILWNYEVIAWNAMECKVTRKNKPPVCVQRTGRPKIHRLNLFIICESVATVTGGYFLRVTLNIPRNPSIPPTQDFGLIISHYNIALKKPAKT